MIRLVKIVNYKKPYVSKVDGKEHPSTSLYLVFDYEDSSGTKRNAWVSIAPRFTQNSNDLRMLEMFAELKVIRAEEGSVQ